MTWLLGTALFYPILCPGGKFLPPLFPLCLIPYPLRLLPCFTVLILPAVPKLLDQLHGLYPLYLPYSFTFNISWPCSQRHHYYCMSLTALHPELSCPFSTFPAPHLCTLFQSSSPCPPNTNVPSVCLALHPLLNKLSSDSSGGSIRCSRWPSLLKAVQFW